MGLTTINSPTRRIAHSTWESAIRTSSTELSTRTRLSTNRPPRQPPPIMKPVVSATNAWSCVVVSVFAIVILSAIAGLYKSGHEEFTGSINDPDPKDGNAVAGTIFTAVIVYAVFLVFCGFQGFLHIRESRKGAIALQ